MISLGSYNTFNTDFYKSVYGEERWAASKTENIAFKNINKFKIKNNNIVSGFV